MFNAMYNAMNREALTLVTNGITSVEDVDRVLVVPCLHPSTNESVEIMILAAEREGWTIVEDETLCDISMHDIDPPPAIAAAGFPTRIFPAN